jgi:hypothetical protein
MTRIKYINRKWVKPYRNILKMMSLHIVFNDSMHIGQQSLRCRVEYRVVAG